MNRVASTALLPLSGLYRAAVTARAALYKAGIFRVHQIGAPVISVGNITAGGTGKTPLVEWVARRCARAGLQVCVLTRGYGRATSRRVVVSDGKSVLADVAQAGDEALWLAERLKEVASVISDADRAAAARWAMENLNSQVFILDDGFQKLSVGRDLNIVTIDATNPWSNGRLLPCGLMREPRAALSRADCVVITRTDQIGSVDELKSEIDRLGGGKPVFLSRMKTCGLRPLPATAQQRRDQNELKSIPVAAFCGLGNPESFFSQLHRDGYIVSYTRSFPDHHKYSQSDIDEFVQASITRGARALLMTAKDEVKLRSLRFDLPCYAVDVEIEIADDGTMQDLIAGAIRIDLHKK